MNSRILIYHGIDIEGRKDLNLRFISAAQFEEQVCSLMNHFELVSLESLTAQPPATTLPRLALTFDDGYLNNLNLAVEILGKYKIPATFFITGMSQFGEKPHWPDALDICVRYNRRPIRFNGEWYFKLGRDYRTILNKRLKHTLYTAQPDEIETVLASFKYTFQMITQKHPELDVYWRLLSPEQIRQLSTLPGLSIGVHGMRHYNLVALPFDIAKQELSDCKNYLENLTGQSIRAVAWPFGPYNEAISNYAASIGLDRQYADFLHNGQPSPYVHTRMGVNPFLSAEELLKAIQRGYY